MIKHTTGCTELLDQRNVAHVVARTGRVGSVFGNQTLCAFVPIQDKALCAWIEEYIAQEVGRLPGIACEPVVEERFRPGIPCQRIPVAVEHIGGRGDRLDQRCERCSLRLRRRWGVRIGTAGELEQVTAFGGRQSESFGESCQGGYGYGRRAALFDPGVPRRADTAERSDLLPPKPTGASPPLRQTKLGGRESLACSPQKDAERVRLCVFFHRGRGDYKSLLGFITG